MAAASYTTDLQVFHTIETTPTSSEFTGYTTGGTPALDTDYPIQGTQHLSAQATKTGLASIAVDFGTNVTWTSGWNFFVWGVFLPASAIDTDANGGLRVIIGSAIGTYKVYNVGGRDFGRYPYGGWMNFVANPELTPDSSSGTATTWRWCGIAANVTSPISKGYPFGLDAIRYGRGELRINGGDLANGYANFQSLANIDGGTSTNRWGLFQEEAGSFRWKGLMILGNGSAVDFRDSNRNIVVDNTRKVLSSFNRIEIRQATSRVDWTNVNITALGTVSRGEWEMINNATVNLNTCNFAGMSTFVFQSNAVVDTCVWRNCGQITPAGATFTECTFAASSDTTGAIVLNSPSDLANISNCLFTGNAKAIRITASGTYNFNGLLFSGNTVQVDFTGTGTCTIIPSGGSNVSQAAVTATGGGTITVSTPAVNVTLTGLKADSEVRAYLGTNPATSTALAGIESSGTSFSFSQSVGGQAGYIQIFHVEYQPVFLELTYSTSDQSIPIQQITDRQYARGTVFTPG